MKLIVHIGTPKTGTTALQQFLHANRQSLAARGFHYATPPHGLPHSNFVANALNAGEKRSVRAFLTKHTDIAHRDGAHTLLVSAENFYAMSVLAAMPRRQACATAVERDHALIETLHSLMPEGIVTAQIVCYFRRPDRYAESLYSQHVKRGISFDGTFDEFLPIIKPALFYNTCMNLWSDVFGKPDCIVRSYESARTDIVRDFLQNVVNVDDIHQVACAQYQGNERVGRDLLEFKRIINRTARFSERDIERTILRLIDEKMELRRSEPECYQDFLSPYRRAELLELVRPELEALQVSYGVPPFPPFDLDSAKANWSPYPGLDQQRRQEIEFHYDRINRRVGFRLERLALRSASLLRRRVPVTGFLLDGLKEMGAKRTLHGFLMGMQSGRC
jgi:hypothetical protein